MKRIKELEKANQILKEALSFFVVSQRYNAPNKSYRKRERIRYNGSMNKRTQYTAEYKAGIVIRMLREEETVAGIAATEGLSPVMMSRWKAEFLERAKMVFDRTPTEAEKELAPEKERRALLEQKVGQLTIENDWLKKNLRKLSPDGRKRLVEKSDCTISISRQTEMLDICRTSVYERPHKEISGETLALMRLIDRHHTDEPTWGYRMITSHL